MQKSLEVSIEDLGDALVSYIGRMEADLTFFPFFIKHSSLIFKSLSGKFSVSLSDEPIHFEKAGKKKKHFFPDNMTFTLSKHEVLDALTYAVAVFKLGTKPAMKISDISLPLPSEIKINLEYAPKGTLMKDAQHNFDGSLE